MYCADLGRADVCAEISGRKLRRNVLHPTHPSLRQYRCGFSGACLAKPHPACGSGLPLFYSNLRTDVAVAATALAVIAGCVTG